MRHHPDIAKPLISVSDISSFFLICVSAYLLCLLWLHDMSGSAAWTIYSAIALLMIEFAISSVSWIAKNQWAIWICSGWLLFLIAGGLLYCHAARPDMIPEDIVFFVFILLCGYLSLRVGAYIGLRLPFSGKAMYECGYFMPLSHGIGFGNRISCILISMICSCGMLGFFMYYHNFPLLAEDPALARYLYFNGPHTSGLTRFAFRACLSGTEVSLMLLIWILLFSENDRNRFSTYPISAISLLSMTMLVMNGSRGPIFEIIVFALLAYSAKIKTSEQIFLLLGAMTTALILLSILSIYRFGKSYDSLSLENISHALYPFFPEVAEGSLVIGEFRDNAEPLLWGRTFLSGLLVLIPSSVSEFREIYDINRHTLEIANVMTETAGGIRITTIGEAYINFGIPGVIVIMFVIGCLLSKACLAQKKSPVRQSFGFTVLSLFFALLPVFTSAYFYLIYTVAGIGFAEKILSRLVSGMVGKEFHETTPHHH